MHYRSWNTTSYRLEPCRARLGTDGTSRHPQFPAEINPSRILNAAAIFKLFTARRGGAAV